MSFTISVDLGGEKMYDDVCCTVLVRARTTIQMQVRCESESEYEYVLRVPYVRCIDKKDFFP